MVDLKRFVFLYTLYKGVKKTVTSLHIEISRIAAVNMGIV